MCISANFTVYASLCCILYEIFIFTFIINAILLSMFYFRDTFITYTKLRHIAMYLQSMTFSGPRGFGKNIDSNSFAKKILFQQSNNICFDLVQLFFLIMKYFPCMLEKNQFFFKFNNKLDFLIHHIKSSSSLIFILRIVIKYGVLKCGMKSYCKKGV